MKFKTELELVDYVIEKLTAQSRKSVSPDNEYMCMYRGSNGSKCATGWLIDDADYATEMETKSARTLQLKWGIFQEEYMLSIYKLQSIHDSYEVEEWPKEFAGLRASCLSK